ncbi:MAG: hypothetical protein EWV76_12635 [Microcystis novacekii Mn_MB_F_20050700_S1]|jgi:hypothetical protein|uniref:Uncharacterized protein n=1 Tax=Microcystis novacekii Mn_MB_F_20050700_S1D TaxID=2486266 RepID=A0A552ICQ1_9CHRO|nr:MAG: hypothetical protein EWV54_24390 [Microcystis novacekii Mn_MB_F_20050700_S1D]TRU86401.1 MAG: hypothetical protein EWV76_12635 [Microcystis novacekii Mn_MB_F_20050700_S1]
MSKPERSTKAHAEVSRLKPDDRLLTPPTNFFSKPHLGETEEGGEWLRLLVFGVIYCFGIKGGIGADTNCASDTKVSLGLGFKNPRQEDSYLKSATP